MSMRKKKKKGKTKKRMRKKMTRVMIINQLDIDLSENAWLSYILG